MTDTTDRVLDWDDEIEHDGEGGGDFVTLPAGEYPFEVVKFERERHVPKEGGKLPACNKAVIHLIFDGGELGKSYVTENLFLHSKTEGILCAFFTSIGQRQHGEKLKMNWSSVIGSTGRAKLSVREYTRQDGSQGSANDVKRWIEPSNGEKPAYTPGAF